MNASRWPALLAIAAACSDPAARVALVPVGDGACGRPAGAQGLIVTAYAASGERTRAVAIDELVDIADFPADTEQLAVEVIAGGGAIAAAGKTAPLAFADLPDGAEIPIAMAPLDDFCPTGPLTEPRAAPLVARAGDGVLVVGGLGPGGAPLTTAERYDPATGAFLPVAVPAVLGENGFVGAALTELPDGRVVVSGGPQPVITVYDPATQAFGASVLIESRAFHAAIALDDRRVLLAGGCSDVAAGACSGVERKSSRIYDVDAPSEAVPGPTLVAGRIGATLFDLGVQRGGGRAYLAAGGTPATGAADPSAADRLILDGDTAAVAGTHAQAAALAGGGVLTAFAADAAPADGAAAVVPPAGTDRPGGPVAGDLAGPAVAVARAPDLSGVRLVALEDGTVAGFGGGAAADVVRYDPTRDRWDRLARPLADTRPPALTAPGAIRLADGSVLVLGGRAAGVAVAGAYRYRPSLLGASTGAVTVVPASASGGATLVPADPARVDRGAGWQLRAPPGELARAVVGGPRMATGRVRAVVRVASGGVALIAQQLAPGQAVVASLVPGAPARIARLEAGGERALCSGGVIAAFDPAANATVELAIGDARVELRRDGVVVAGCDLGEAPRTRGSWGVAAAGSDAAGEVAVETVTVAR